MDEQGREFRYRRAGRQAGCEAAEMERERLPVWFLREDLAVILLDKVNLLSRILVTSLLCILL